MGTVVVLRRSVLFVAFVTIGVITVFASGIICEVNHNPQNLRSHTIQYFLGAFGLWARASDKYRVQAEEAGVTLMLGKPFSEDELIINVRRLMGEHLSAIEEEPAALETL